MELGSGIAIASLVTGFCGTAMVTIAKYGKRNGNKYVTKEVFEITYNNLEKDIAGINKKLDEIYDFMLGKK